MFRNFPLFPDAASTTAPHVDQLFFFHLAVTAFFSILIFTLVFYFAVKYRRRSAVEVPEETKSHLVLEVTWTAIPLLIVTVMFVWGAVVFLQAKRIPQNATEIYVVGKQWMWKIQHPEGQREINTLHVPAGRPIKLILASEDVIHDFFIPAFRIKQDVVPGRLQSEWFQATRPGEYHLFCAQYCGTAHSAMIGKVIVMDQTDYENWIGGSNAESMAAAGQRLFDRFGCGTCHLENGKGRGPVLGGVFGRGVGLEDGRVVMADEEYLRESILLPRSKIVAGYPPIMPTFQGQIDEEGLMQIVAYLKSLKGQERVE